MIAYAKLFKEIGSSVILWLDQDYRNIVANSEFPIIWFPEEKPQTVDILFLVNPSTKNHVISQSFKCKGTRIIYLYHEPWESFRQYLKEGLKQALKATVAHYFSSKLLPLVDLVIVPSEYALKLYNRLDIRYNKKVIKIPLLFDDELSGTISVAEKEYFSYIGHAVKGHAFDKYIESIKYIYRKGENLKFEIATQTDLSNLVARDKILKEMIKKGILKISHGRPLTNSEINAAYKRSFCVWNVYRRSTQSGVLPKAFMFGTPVIASSIGSFPELVKTSYNGELIKNSSDFISIEKNLTLIKKNFQTYSRGARKSFEEIFYYKSNVNKLKSIISKLY